MNINSVTNLSFFKFVISVTGEQYGYSSGALKSTYGTESKNICRKLQLD
jgi:hypothetical protein